MRIHALYAQHEGSDGSYAGLVDRVLQAALARYGLAKQRGAPAAGEG